MEMTFGVSGWYGKGYEYPVGCEYFQFHFDRYHVGTEDPLFREYHGKVKSPKKPR